MTWPIHKNPNNGDESIAPYNFVPLPEKVFLHPDKEEVCKLHEKYYTENEKRHTGWVDLTIKTETPLYSRCAYDPTLAEKDIIKEPSRQHFFHHGEPNIPFIPGSSLRGMVRSLVEIIGYGKMQWVKDEKLVYRAVGDPTSFGQSYREKIMGKDQSKKDTEMRFEYPSTKLKGGYLEKHGHGWAIRPALGSPDFYKDDFKSPFAIKKLCKAINDDNFNIPINATINTIDWLNELLKVTNFYDILQKEKKIKFSNNVTDLIRKTDNYRNSKKKYLNLEEDEQGNIKRLNRLLLEETYPHETPKHVNTFGESFIHINYRDVSSWVTEGSLNTYEIYVRPSARLWSSRGRRGGKSLHINLAEANAISRTAAPGLVKASLVASGHMGGKHWHCAIYESDPGSTPILIPDNMWGQYEEDTKLSRSTRTETRKLKNEGDPLFYLLDDSNNLGFFGSTMCFRLPYNYSTLEFVPELLKEKTGLDLAEAIFGTVKKGNKISVKGRVSFEDAEWKNKEKKSPFFANSNNGRNIPNILSSPKPTAFQHYLVQPEMEEEKERMHYNSTPVKSGAGETVIRGHKLYWHKKFNNEEEYVKDPNARFEPIRNGVEQVKQYHKETQQWRDSTQHTIIRPVKKDVEFSSRVHFENLSDIELGALLTALQLPDNKRHKLGMGKPLGMGSIKIEATLHISDRKKRYETFSCISDEKSTEDTQKIEKTAKETFRDEILKHHGVENGLKDLWSIPRLRELAVLLEWKNPPKTERTRYVGIGRNENDNQWRKRKILPTPLKVSGIEESVSVQTVTTTKNNLFSSYLNSPCTKLPTPRFCVGKKVPATIVSIHNMKVVVALEDGSKLPFDPPYLFNYTVGETIEVKIKNISPDGMKITSVKLV